MLNQQVVSYVFVCVGLSVSVCLSVCVCVCVCVCVSSERSERVAKFSGTIIRIYSHVIG